MSNTFCILPFIHLEARSDSHVAPCCMSQEFYKKDDGTLFSLSNDSLSEVWNSKAIQTLRSALLNNEKPTACKSCWFEEANGAESKRIRENNRWGTNRSIQLKFLDLKLGTTCNLKCRICGPGSSSLWKKESVEVAAKMSNRKVKGLELNIVQWPEYNEKFWDDLGTLLPTIELFEIYGGEPFLIKRHFDLLKQSVELGYSQKQRIHYNTNGTVYPVDAVTLIWPKFKEVDIMLSIDGIGEQFEYQRHPAKWNLVEENLNRFMLDSNCRTEICLSVSNFNVYYLPEYLSYFSKKGLNVWLNVVYTDELAIQRLPIQVKEKIIQKLQNVEHKQISYITQLLKSETSDDVIPKFLARVRAHDEYRGENFQKVFPEYWEILAPAEVQARGCTLDHYGNTR